MSSHTAKQRKKPKRTLLPLYQTTSKAAGGGGGISSPPQVSTPTRRSFEIKPTRSRSFTRSSLNFALPTRTKSFDHSNSADNNNNRRRRNSGSHVLPSYNITNSSSQPSSPTSSPTSINRKRSIRPAPSSGGSYCLPSYCLSTTMTSTTPTSPQQQEQLPDEAPLPTFFLPNFLGIVFAYGLESLGLEGKLQNLISPQAHRFALLGFGVFCIANTNSYLGGSVVLARLQYNVKLPNLYATTKDSKGVAFNCVQRGHQNFLETYAQLVLSVLFVALIRPNIAGVMLIVVAIARIFYARSYRVDIPSRIGPLLIAMFTMSIGIGYGFLVAMTAFGFQLIDL